jgi:addiction module RelE/StbE family toxin
MKFITSKNFDKQFSKLPKKIKEKAIQQFEIFIADPANHQLNNHSLQGKYAHCRSINITGDIRAIYTQIDSKIESATIVRFITIASHANLYK